MKLPTKRILSDIRATNISKSFTHKMAAETSWRGYGTKLRQCRPIYTYGDRDTFASEMTYIVSGGALNSTQTKPEVTVT